MCGYVLLLLPLKTHCTWQPCVRMEALMIRKPGDGLVSKLLSWKGSARAAFTDVLAQTQRARSTAAGLSKRPADSSARFDKLQTLAPVSTHHLCRAPCTHRRAVHA
jgi:hypothetical protein